MKKIRVLLVDDHSMVVDGFESLLEDEPEIEVVGKVLNGPDALNLLSRQTPDVMVVDLELQEGFDGIRLIEESRELYPELRVLVLSSYNTDKFITRVLAVGASGYVVKNRGIDELVDAIKSVNHGKKYYSDEVTATIMDSLQKPAVPEKPTVPEIKFTKREKDVLTLIVDGLTGPEIAERLFIAASTVETHRRNIIEKVGVKSKELITFTLRNGLLD